MSPTPYISLVIPIYSEEEVLPELLERTQRVFDELGHSYEIVFVDDGSTDRSVEILRDAQRAGCPLRVVRLSRNFGLQHAVTAGLAHARGDLIALMDGDLQDPPELFPEMLAKLDEGHDVVYMLKRSRDETLLRKAGFATFYWLFRKLSRTPIPPTAGLFSLMRRPVVRGILSCAEREKFIPGLRAWVGHSQAGLEFDREARKAGAPRQTLGRLIKLAMDATYSFTDLPLKLALVLGLGTASLSLAAVLIISSLRVFTDLAIPGWASTLVSIFFMGGVQLVCLGLLGEYISRIYDEVRRRPQYLVREVLEPGGDMNNAAPAPSEEEVEAGPPPA